MNRPRVVVVVASSIDGKIATSARGALRFTSRADRRMLQELRADVDAVLIGAGTLRGENPPLQLEDEALLQRRRQAGLEEKILNIVLSSSLRLPVNSRFFATPGVPRIVATVEDAREDLARELEGRAEIVRAGRGRVDVARLLEILHDKGVHRLQVEGGGDVNAAFFEADCVDEICLTVAPLVIGGRNAPTPCDGEGFITTLTGGAVAFPAFELLDCRSEGGEVFLRYGREQVPAGKSRTTATRPGS